MQSNDIVPCTQTEEIECKSLKMGEAVVEVSSRFSETDAANLDDALNLALSRFGEAAEADRSYLFVFSDDRKRMSNTHEWCAEAIHAEKENLQDLPLEDFTDFFASLGSDGMVHVSDVAAMPEEQAEFKAHLAQQGIQSMICFPVVWNKQIHGFVGFDAVHRKNPWSEYGIGVLRTLAQMISNLLKRMADDRELLSNEARMHLVIENMPVMLNALDEEGNIIVWNRECERVTGYAASEVIGNPKIWEQLYPDTKYRVNLFKEWQESEELREREYVLLAKDGKNRHIAWSNVSKKIPIPGWYSWSIGQDITQRRLAEQELLLSANEWVQAMDQLDDVIYLLDLDRHLVRANHAFYEMMHTIPDKALGRHIEAIVHPEGEEEPCPVCRAQMELKEGIIVMETDDPNNPSGCPIEIALTLLRDPDQKPKGMIMKIHDLTATREWEEGLRLAASVFDNTKSGLMITDRDGVIRQVNPAFTVIAGYSAEEAVGRRPSLLKSEHHDASFYRKMWRELIHKGHWEGEVWNRRKNGELFPVWLNITGVRDEQGRIKYFIANFNDITEQKQYTDHIYRLAHYDLVTDLPNRRFFEEVCSHALKRAERNGEAVALLFLDLDRFKHVNDSLGHPAGDELLRQVAGRLKTLMRSEDVVARLGGDEFVVLLERIKGVEAVQRVAEKILELFEKPFILQEHRLVLSTSIGISLYPEDGKDVTTLVKHADTAMYQAKESGRNTFRFFSKELSGKAMERLALESDLRRGLEHQDLVLHYQPQYRLDNGRIEGAEALLRWLHPERGMVSPDQFIPVAEESGLILSIGEWVLNEACSQAKSWLDRGLSFGKISVNISGLQIQRGDIVHCVRKALDASGLPPHHLELEILETYIMRQAERDIAILQALCDLGVSLAIDDFGTGQASLAYLKRLPVQKLKIDRSFISDIPEDANDVAITRAIMAMAKSMQLGIVAEGVETEKQSDFLSALGCDQAQGFYFSRPLDSDGFESLLMQSSGD